MRRYAPIFFLGGLIVVLFFPRYFARVSDQVLHNFALTILPSLAPAMLFDYLFIHSDGLSFLYQWISRHNHHPQRLYPLIIIALGLFSGTPTLASYVEDSLEKGLLSQKEGERILGFFMLPSLPFVIGVLLPFLPRTYRFILLLLLFLPPCALYLMKRSNAHESSPSGNIILTSNTRNIFNAAIMSTVQTMFLLLGTILLFSLPLALFETLWDTDTAYRLIGLFEFTSSSLFLSQHLSRLNFVFMIILLSLSSTSVVTQISILCPRVSLLKVMKKRLGFAALASIGALIGYLTQII